MKAIDTRQLTEFAVEYLRKVLRREKHDAVHLIVSAAETGTSIEDLYLNVLQPVQREIGRLWQNNEITVAQEHYCTAITQLIMSQLYRYVFATKRNGHRMVITCIGGELHEVGARMVADLFELKGWDTCFLGANTPADSVVAAIEEHGAELIGISATMNYGLTSVRELIDRIKSQGSASHVAVLVGGRPFLLSDSLWRATGADGFAPDAVQAVSVGDRLVESGGTR